VTTTVRRSLGEWAVLGLLAERSSHPFALARLLGGDGPLGKVLTVRRPLVYRAVERLANDGLIARHRTEPGESGPQRTVYRITTSGTSRLDAWLDEPVDRIRELRLGFLLKVTLLGRLDRESAPLINAQQEALADAFGALAAVPEDADAADLWRRHSAAAAAAFLDELVRRA
jgi:DNA-binding PadR family transcriptional regulator